MSALETINPDRDNDLRSERLFFFFSCSRRHTRSLRDWSSDVCSSDLEGRDSPGNHGRLCVKGRYGWDYALHEQRLTKPLIRRPEFYPKGPLSNEVKDSAARQAGGLVNYDRSEERRVGKECRCGGVMDE